jgi:hypothetical protein
MRQPAAYNYLVAIVTKVNTNMCIVWPLRIDKGGYGRLTLPLSIGGEKKVVSAHRLAYKIKYGEWPMPNGMHSCDNRACFNPLHISPGTAKDNNADMVAKGRQARGEGAGLSKLTDELVTQIRQEYVGGLSVKQLARKYGISSSGMMSVIDGTTWKHVPNPIKQRRPAGWNAEARKGREATHCFKGHPFTPDNTLLWRGFRRCAICRHASEKKVRLVKKMKKLAEPPKPRIKHLRTHCLKGHLLEVDNCYIKPDGHRQCRICKSDRGRRYYQQKKQRGTA